MEEWFDVPLVPMHRFHEPNVQVPSAEPVLKAAVQAELADLRRRLASEKKPTQAEQLRKALTKCEADLSRLEWGAPGQPEAASLSLRVVLYAEKEVEPEQQD